MPIRYLWVPLMDGSLSKVDWHFVTNRLKESWLIEGKVVFTSWQNYIDKLYYISNFYLLYVLRLLSHQVIALIVSTK